MRRDKELAYDLDAVFVSLFQLDDVSGLESAATEDMRFYRLEDGSDLLMQAILADANDIAKYLVNQWDFNEIEDHHGRTALHYAADLKNLHLYAFLAETGWNVMAKDHGGQTPSNLILKALI